MFWHWPVVRACCGHAENQGAEPCKPHGWAPLVQRLRRPAARKGDQESQEPQCLGQRELGDTHTLAQGAGVAGGNPDRDVGGHNDILGGGGPL